LIIVFQQPPCELARVHRGVLSPSGLWIVKAEPSDFDFGSPKRYMTPLALNQWLRYIAPTRSAAPTVSGAPPIAEKFAHCVSEVNG
jgi:hypothetical protein